MALGDEFFGALNQKRFLALKIEMKLWFGHADCTPRKRELGRIQK
jgi:hypothetical protein